MRTFAVLALLILLNACALPAAYSVATLAIDGISYATSGKGLSDHAISAVANEDCAMWRALQARPICRDADVPETMVAAAPGVAAAPAAEESEVLAMVLGAAPAAGGPVAPETATTETPTEMAAATAMPGEFEATAAAFAAIAAAGGSMVAATPEPDGSEAPAAVIAVAPPAGGLMAPETAMAEAPGEPEVTVEVLAAVPAAGGPVAPETATTETPAETPAATASPAIRPTAMAATKPEPLAAMTGTPATTAAKPIQLAALAVPLPSMEAKPKFGRFVVLASYLKEAHARAAMKRGQAFAPRMARVRVRGKLYYRVVSGPYARDAIGAMRRTMIGGGFPDAWAATLCQTTLRLAPCPAAPLPLNLTAN